MDSRTLRYFVNVARAQSFSRAALNLHVAQSALSRQVRKLEEEVGASLFVRASAGLELTDAGRHLLERAEPLLQDLGEALRETREMGNGLSGAVSIGVSPATCEVLPPLIARACVALHPGVRLSFVEGFSGFIFRQLLAQELTLCLLHNPAPHRNVRAEPLLEEAMQLIGPGEGLTPLAPVRKGMKVEELPMVLPNPDHALRTLVERAVGGRLKVVLQTDGVVTTRALVAAGLGYTILPFSAVQQELADGRLSALPLPRVKSPWRLSLAFLDPPALGGAARAVADVIRREVGALALDGRWGRAPAPDPIDVRAG